LISGTARRGARSVPQGHWAGDQAAGRCGWVRVITAWWCWSLCWPLQCWAAAITWDA